MAFTRSVSESMQSFGQLKPLLPTRRNLHMKTKFPSLRCQSLRALLCGLSLTLVTSCGMSDQALPKVLDVDPYPGAWDMQKLTDKNADPNIVEVDLEARVTEVEYLPGKRLRPGPTTVAFRGLSSRRRWATACWFISRTACPMQRRFTGMACVCPTTWTATR